MNDFLPILYFVWHSYDLRDKSEPLHWHDEALLGERAKFYAEAASQYLLIRGLQQQDAGLYKCRVDFQREASINSRVNLTIVGKSGRDDKRRRQCSITQKKVYPFLKWYNIIIYI